MSTIYVKSDQVYTQDVVAEAIAQGADIVVEAGSVTQNSGTLGNTTFAEGDNAWYYADNTRTDGKVADVEINGSVSAGQFIVNNGSVTVNTTGKLFVTNTHVTVCGANGLLSYVGTRTNETAVTEDMFQGRAGYVRVRDGATLSLKDTFYKVAANEFTLNNGTFAADNSYVFIAGHGDNTRSTPINLSNGAALNITNGSIFTGNDKKGTPTNITIDGTSTLTVAGSKLLKINSITNNGALIISGESTVTADKFSGSGWVYMKGATVGADTKLIGANVRFASGTNVVDGATIDGGRFQVGTGLWGQADPLVDSTVTVTVKNDARIGGTGHASPFGGWIGSQGYDGKDSTLFETKYTLNIYNSIADFDYMHISHDGLMNVVGDASVKDTYAGFDYSYWSGQLNINGIAIFDNVDAAVLNTNVSVDNASSKPGRLIIRNNAFYEADHDNRGSNGGTFKISKTGVVDVLTGATLLVIGKTNISAQGTLNINGATYEHRTASDPDGPDVTNAGVINITNGNFSATGSVINNGTLTVTGNSTLNITDLQGEILVNGAASLSGAISNAPKYYQDPAILRVAGENAKLTIAEGVTMANQGLYVNIGKSEKVDGVSTVTATGAIDIKGTMYAYAFVVEQGSTATVSGKLTGNPANTAQSMTDGTTYIEGIDVSGTMTIENGGMVAGAYTTVNGILNIEQGGSLYVYAGRGGELPHLTTVNGILNVAGTFKTHRSITVGAAGQLNLTGGTLSFEDLCGDTAYGLNAMYNSVITNYGTMTITADSLLTAYSIDNNGSIVIDDTNITVGAGLKKIIDLNQSGALTKVSLVEGSANSLVFGADGDVYITNQNASTIYVNAAWEGAEVGTAVEGGYIYGLNAFSSFDEIFDGAVSAETTKLVIAGGTYSSLFNTTTGVSIMSGLSAVEASGNVVVDLGSLVFGTEVAGNVYVTGNFTTTDPNTWSTEHGLQPYYNGAIQFKGTETTIFNIDGIFNAAEGFAFDTGKAIISADSVLTVNNQHCGQINVYGDVVSYGKMSVDLQVGSTLRLVNIEEQGKLTLSGKEASLYTNIIKDQPWAGAQCVDFYISNGSLVVEKGATVEATGIVEVYADSSITVDSSSFTAGIVDNKAGYVTVSGESIINIGTLTGRMTLKDATLGNGSGIGGKAGCVDLAGEEVNFNGTVLIENAVNANASTDATVININKGANVTFNTKQYNDGTYSGGFNSSSADTLNVYGNLTISGDNVYLKAATLVDKDAVFNISDAGFQNTYGTLTIKGAMNITDTAEGGYQNIKLSGNDNASTTGDLDIVGGTLTINAPSFSFGGGFKSNGWVDVKSATVDVTEGGKINTNAVVFRNGVNSTLTLDNGSLVFTAAGEFGNVHSTLGTAVDNFGAIVAVNGSILDFGTRNLINEGSISFDLTSTLSANSITGAGSINISINTKQLTTGYTLINQTGADAALDITNINVTIDGVESTLANLFGEDVFAVIDDGYVLMKSDNDLVVSSVNTLYVSSDLAETAAGTVITVNGGQYVVGVNAFASLKAISGKVSEAPCTIVYDYAADLDAGKAGIIVTVKNDGTSLVSYNVNGEYHNFYSSRTHEIAFDSNATDQTVKFVFTSGDFSFTSTPVESNVAEAIVSGATEDVSVDEIAGDKVYTFSVTEEQGDFSCAISDVTGTGEIAIYALDTEGNRVELVAGRLFNRDTTFGVDKLAEGSYEVVFSGYGYNAEADFEANMTLTQYEIPDCRKDDTLESVTDTTPVSSVAGKAGEPDGRGEVDTTDWIKLNGFTAGVQNALEFTVSGSPVSVSLYNGAEQLLANFYVYDNKEGDAVDYTRYFSAATDVVYARLSTTGEASYSVAVAPLA